MGVVDLRISHNLKIESVLFVTIVRTLSPEDRVSVALRNCSEEAKEGVRLHASLQQSRQAV